MPRFSFAQRPMYVVYGALVILSVISLICIRFSLALHQNQVWLQDKLSKSVGVQESLGSMIMTSGNLAQSVRELAIAHAAVASRRLDSHDKTMVEIVSLLRLFSRHQSNLTRQVERTAEFTNLHNQVLRRSARQQRQHETCDNVF